GSFGELFESFPVAFVRPLLCSIEFPPPRGGFGGSHDQAFSVGADFEWSFGVDLQEVEDRPIDHQREAVPMFRELLQHACSIYTMYHHWNDAAETATPPRFAAPTV